MLITFVFFVIFSVISIILIERLDCGIDLSEIMWTITISSSFVLTLSLSIIKRNIKVFLHGIIYILVFVVIFHISMFVWLISSGPFIPFD